MRFATRKFALALLIVAVATVPAVAQQAVSVAALLQHAAAYDGKTVSVVGQIADYRERVSAKGNAYTTFRLADHGGSVSVFKWGHPSLRDGERVRVIGTFAAVKHVGSYTFYNEIEAQTIQALQASTVSSDSSGPTALCNDGTYSYAAHHQGACSHHGGVAVWYK